MKFSINRKRLQLYLWIGCAYLALWLFHNLMTEPETFLPRAVNNIWLVAYLATLNFILFEYVIPSIRLRWTRVLAAPFLLFAMSMLFSFGIYWWRALGIELHIYTALRTHPSVMEGVEYHAPYSFVS